MLLQDPRGVSNIKHPLPRPQPKIDQKGPQIMNMENGDDVIPPHLKVLEELKRNYYCKICNELIITAKVLDCGHTFCTYCLDLLPSLSMTCPVCSTRVKTLLPLPKMDDRIDSLIRLLPPPFQYARAGAKLTRSEKVKERSGALDDLRAQLSPKGQIRTGRSGFNYLTVTNNVDEICSNILSSTSGLRDRNAQGPNFLPDILNDKSGRGGVRSRPKSRHQGSRIVESSKVEVKASPSQSQRKVVTLTLTPTPQNDIDGGEMELEKVEQGLLGIYEDFLQEDRQPQNEGVEVGAGDAISSLEGEGQGQDQGQAGMMDKDCLEIEGLLNEAEGLLELDSFVKDWSSEMSSRLMEDDGEMGFFLGDGLIQQVRELQGRSNLAIKETDDLAIDGERSRERSRHQLSLEWRKSSELDLDESGGPLQMTDYDLALQTLKSHLGLSDPVEEGHVRRPRYPQTARGSGDRGRDMDLDLRDDRGEEMRSCKSARHHGSGRNSQLLSHYQETSSNFVENTATFCRKLDDCKNALLQLRNTNIATSRPERISQLLPRKECKTARLPHDFRSDSQKPRSRPQTQLRSRLPPIDLNSGTPDLVPEQRSIPNQGQSQGFDSTRPWSRGRSVLYQQSHPQIMTSSPFTLSSATHLGGTLTAEGQGQGQRKSHNRPGPSVTQIQTPRDLDDGPRRTIRSRPKQFQSKF